MIKIAKSVVDGLARGGREASFVRMIIELARTLGVAVIAEGIETQEQADALVALECDYGQGFPPGPPRAGEADARAQACRLKLTKTSYICPNLSGPRARRPMTSARRT